MNPRVGIPATGFKHEHAHVGVLRKPVCQGATRRTCTDDDIIVVLVAHTLLPGDA
jgi:hypothetical protein